MPARARTQHAEAAPSSGYDWIMVETWLGPNRRALVAGMTIPALFSVLALLLALGGLGAQGTFATAAGWMLFGLGFWVVAALARQLFLPRVGFERGEVLFYLRAGLPIRVPLEVVECFLLGQEPRSMPAKQSGGMTVANVVVRLAEKNERWSRVDVKPSLARWCDGYITIRGTWCETLDVELIQRLNRHLATASRAAVSRPADGGSTTPRSEELT